MTVDQPSSIVSSCLDWVDQAAAWCCLSLASIENFTHRSEPLTPHQPLFASAALSDAGRQRAARFAGRLAGLLLFELFLLSGAAIQPLLASPAVSQGTREETNPEPREGIDQDCVRQPPS